MMHNLRCNNIECKEEAKKLILLTQCGHIFCNQCTGKVKNIMRCIACSTFLQTQDVKIKEINRKPNLHGFPPDTLLETCRSGIMFWFYQMSEEIQITKLSLERENAELQKRLGEAEVAVAKLQADLDFANQKLEKNDNTLERERQTVFDLHGIIDEKNKEINKLSAAFEKLKFGMQNAGNPTFRNTHPSISFNHIDVDRISKGSRK